MKKTLSLILCLVLLFSCITVAHAGEEYQETITIGTNADSQNRDIQNTASVVDRANATLIFDTLLHYNTETGEVGPCLAETWNVVSETEWNFKLRKDVVFHDGTPMTAEDVKFSFDRGVQQANSGANLKAMKEMVINDEYDVTLFLSKPDPDIIYKLCDINLAVFSKDAFDSMDVSEAVLVGSGPYKCTEYIQGSHFSFTRNDAYWGELPKTKNIVIRYIAEGSARLIALQTGEIDVCLEPPATDMHYVAEDPNLTLYQVNGTNLRYVWINVNVEPFNNKLVRQAISSAICREDVIAMVYEGNATLATNVMHPDNEFYDGNVAFYDYDEEKALQLLAEAGYPDGFDTTIYCTTGNTQKAVATAVQAQLAAIGINCKVEAQESATFAVGVAPGGTYPLAVDGWGGYATGPDKAMRTVFYTGAATNRCNISDPVVDALIDKAFSTDNQVRKEAYSELEAYLMEECVWVPIAIERLNVATKKEVQGFTKPFGTIHQYRNLFIVK